VKRHNSRHKRSGQCLEEQGEGGQKTTKVAAKTRAKSQHASKQGADRKEQGDQFEGEHESRQVEVLARSQESLWHTCRRVEVAMRWWIERKGRMYSTAIILSIDHRAKIPECPSMIAPKSWDACGIDLKEVERVQRTVIRGASEDDEEHHGKGACHEYQGKQGEE
jgi:hypothetical protein